MKATVVVAGLSGHTWIFGGFSIALWATSMDQSAYIAGELSEWPSKLRLASLLRSAGLRVQVGNYSIRVLDCSHFSIEHYGGDLGDPQVEADADSLAELMHDAKLVSDALAVAQIRHRFEIYGADDVLVGYLHYDWPQPCTQ